MNRLQRMGKKRKDYYLLFHIFINNESNKRYCTHVFVMLLIALPTDINIFRGRGDGRTMKLPEMARLD